MEITSIVEKQKQKFLTGDTKRISHRLKALQDLKDSILFFEDELYDALKKDLNKGKLESYLTEIHMVLSEITLTQKRLKKWMKPKKVNPGILNFPSKAFIKPDPFGVVLIISPWNYPFQLLFSPLVGAIAGGNCVILKPSEISSYTTKVSLKIIERAFSSDFISIFPGGVEITTQLLNIQTDYIFFTGSTNVGKIVAKAASNFLTPYTLELGGKSPCIVDRECDLKRAAKRVLWGKLINSGQTCVAPDYLYIHEDIKKEFISLLKKYEIEFYGNNSIESQDYCKIINENHFNRLKALLSQGNIISGGATNIEKLKIAPTLIDNVPEDNPLMTEEIFGPILPIKTFKSINEVPLFIEKQGKPLALYFFSKNIKNIDYILENTSSGGVCINDTISHLVSHNLPFGGVAESGNGAYHGEESFKTFTHSKSILKKGKFDPKIKFAPYNNEEKIISLFKKIF